MSTLKDLTPAQQTARDIWTSGDYPEVADRLIRGFGPTLVEELKIHGGQQVLDIACGDGNVAIPAAVAGADVTGTDITPALLERGRDQSGRGRRRHRLGRGRRRGAPVRRRELRHRHERGRRDVLPEPPGGCRRARARLPPRRQDRAHRLDARGPDRLAVQRPGAVRTAAAGRHAARLRCGAPTSTCAPCSERASTDLRNERRKIVFDGLTPDSFVDLMRVNYGPVLRVFNRLADDPGRTEALDAALRRFVRTHDHGEPGRSRLEAEYQLTLARRR